MSGSGSTRQQVKSKKTLTGWTHRVLFTNWSHSIEQPPPLPTKITIGTDHLSAPLTTAPITFSWWTASRRGTPSTRWLMEYCRLIANHLSNILLCQANIVFFKHEFTRYGYFLGRVSKIAKWAPKSHLHDVVGGRHPGRDWGSKWSWGKGEASYFQRSQFHQPTCLSGELLSTKLRPGDRQTIQVAPLTPTTILKERVLNNPN